MTHVRGRQLWRATLVALVLGALLGACGSCAMVEQNRRNQADATACQGGDAAACLRQGDLWRNYRSGPNREVDALERTVDAYGRACAGGLADGCLRLVVLYATDAELAADRARGQPFALRACELGRAAGCGLAASWEPSEAERTRLVERSCQLDIETCLGAAEALAELPDAAYRIALSTCTTVPTQCLAATRFARSQGERGELLGHACSAGLHEHCAGAARELEQTGARARALELLRVGCRGGDQSSCAALGTLLAAPGGP